MPAVRPHGRTLRCGRFVLSLDRPLVMGVVNITPDSFSDGGKFIDPVAAIAQGRRLVEEGADMLDLGAESTRPGAAPVSAQAELDRLLPVLDGLADVPVPISVDTMKPEVMHAAIAHGAGMINDITALAAPGAIETVARTDAAVCLMHMQGEPRTMQLNPTYADVVREVREFLEARIAACVAGGIAAERIIVDPGFGFGKTVDHNLELLRSLDVFARLGAGVLSGWSRKSSLGKITGRPTAERLVPSVTAAVLSVQRGATIVRVHDVAATRDALAVLAAVEKT